MWRERRFHLLTERSTGTAKIRSAESTHTRTLPAGLTYQLCKWLDRHGYTWEFENNKFYGTPYEVDERVFYEGVELFMEKISSVKPRHYQVERCIPRTKGTQKDYPVTHGFW